MDMNKIAKIVTLDEGKKESISIAQVKEVLRVLNKRTNKKFYPWIKNQFEV